MAPKTKPIITVGIVTRNRREELILAIRSVYTQGIDNVEILVVDNDSEDGTTEMLFRDFPDVRVIRLRKNPGCPGERNYIHANARGDYIVNLDDDAYLGEGALRRLIETFEADPAIGIVSMGVRFIEKTDPDESLDEKMYEVGCFRGTASAVRKTMIDEIGDYPDDFFLYHEERHLSIRAMSAGYKIVQRPSCFVWHPVLAGTDGTRLDFFRYRNAMVVIIDLYPGWLMVKYLSLRLGSHALISLRRGTFHKYLAAVAVIFWRLPHTLITRQACSAEAVKKFYRLRHAGQVQNLA